MVDEIIQRDNERQGSSNTGIVAVVVIFIVAAVLGFLAWHNSSSSKAADGEPKQSVEITTPAAPQQVAPAANMSAPATTPAPTTAAPAPADKPAASDAPASSDEPAPASTSP